MSVAVSTAVIGAGVLGAGAAIYGANKQSDEVSKTNDANTKNIASQNQAAWNNYLLSRGLNTGGSATVGTIPGVAAGGAVNTKLPFWATMQTPTPTVPGGPTWVKKSAAPAPGSAPTLAGAFG